MLLDDACSQKSNLPMSLSLLLHYLQSATLPADPSVKQNDDTDFNIELMICIINKLNWWFPFMLHQDGGERWRKWDELLQLLWMLMLSYEEVVTGNLTIFSLYTHILYIRHSRTLILLSTFVSQATYDIPSRSVLIRHALHCGRRRTRWGGQRCEGPQVSSCLVQRMTLAVIFQLR